LNIDIKKRIEDLNNKVSDKVKIIAVSKTKPIEDMEVAYNCGIRDFGENKVQEILSKYDNFHKDVRWHLIGHLQTNKVKYIVGKVSLIQSLDSINLLKKIDKVYGNNGKIANVLIQINIGREEQKYGILEEDLDKLLQEIEKCEFVRAKGIMVIIPKGNTEENRMSLLPALRCSPSALSSAPEAVSSATAGCHIFAPDRDIFLQIPEYR